MNKDKIKNLIEELIYKTTFNVEGICFNDENGVLWCNIKTQEPYLFIGKYGETLGALNHIVRKIIEKNLIEGENKNDSEKIPPLSLSGYENIIIDVNEYQKKRIENVKAIAHMMAERARFFKSNIEVDPMSAYERRIIHEFLSDKTDVKTESVGEGPDRRVVIKYVGNGI